MSQFRERIPNTTAGYQPESFWSVIRRLTQILQRLVPLVQHTASLLWNAVGVMLLGTICLATIILLGMIVLRFGRWLF